MSSETWLIRWSWRTWTFGLTFGPEVDELHLGPLMCGRVREAFRV